MLAMAANANRWRSQNSQDGVELRTAHFVNGVCTLKWIIVWCTSLSCQWKC